MLAAVGVLALLMLLLLFVRKDKPLTERERARAHKFWSVSMAFDTIGAAVYAIGLVGFAVVTAVMGQWKVAAISFGFAVLFVGIGVMQRRIARREREKLD